MEEIKAEVLAKVAEANGLIIAPREDANAESIIPRDMLTDELLEEGAIAMDLDEPLPDEE
jgi:hypothetical protein